MLARLLDQPRLVVLGAVAAIAALAWLDLWRRASEMNVHAAMGMAMPRGAPWDLADLGTIIGMWAVMMVAMMLPSAAPVLLLFSRMQRSRPGRGGSAWPTGLFAAGYLVVWGAWSVLAASLQWALQAWLLLSPALTTTSALLGSTLLVLAGIYQVTPWKNACLARCQSPLGFLLGRWHDGAAGAFRMGLHHGLSCVGCCWALMALLFVGGVMNLLWVAALAVFVLAEKVVTQGRWLAYASGLGLVAWGLYVLRAGLTG